MPRDLIERFREDDRRFAVDPETCFCFECDAISWDVLEYYPHTPVNRIYHLLEGQYRREELTEVVGELEWLRATKSILAVPKREDLLKAFEVERGLKKLSVALSREGAGNDSPPTSRRWFSKNEPHVSETAVEIGRKAVALLLNRSGIQNDLHLEFIEDRTIHAPELIADLCEYALNMARVAGKRLTVAVHVADWPLSSVPEALKGHAVGVKLEIVDAAAAREYIRAVWAGNHSPPTLPRLAKAIQPAAAGIGGRIVVRPNHAAFGKVVEVLDDAGFSVIEIDTDAAYVAHPGLDPGLMLESLRQSAVYYAERLLAHHYFKLDPMASLFWRIYNGTPLWRSDPAGTNELAIDETGAIYPCRNLMGVDAFLLGSVAESTLDEDAVRRFEDVGSVTTAPCIRCWARNFCGGGAVAVHHAFTGSFRTPHDPWCDMQRAWMRAAIAAFQLLSSKGVHFERIYNTLGHLTSDGGYRRLGKPSLFTLARAALTMTIGVRPIEEADAPLLTQWENWNESAYFLFNETGVLLATKYDREMDSLHPRETDHELVLLRKNGTPFGLFKVRPDRIPGAAHAWGHLHDEKDYAAETIRKGFRALLKEAAGQQAIRRLTVPAAPWETALQAFLEAVGFTREGVLREALYLHGRYHDVALFSIAADTL